MAEITLRTAGSITSANATVKGSPLTNFEVDNNFSNINIVVDSLSNVFSTTTGVATITGNLVPAAANTYDLGTAAAPFRDIYTSGNSLHLGSLVISTVGGNIALDGTEVLSATGGATPADGTITAAKLDTGAVTEAKLDTGAVTASKIGTEAVTNVKLAEDIDIKGNLTVQAGSVGSPSLRANADTNTGIYFPLGDSVAVSVGGEEKANINPLGYFTGIYSDKVVALGNSGTNPNIDCRSGTVFTMTLDNDATLTLQNTNPTGATSLTLVLTNDATPSRSLTLAGGSFRYPFGAISRTTGAGNVDVWFFFTADGGTNWNTAIPMKDLY